MDSSGKRLRLSRILDPKTKRGVVVAYDHGLMLGAIPGLDPPRERVKLFIEAGCNAVLITPGLLRQTADIFAGHGTGIIMRVDWTNMWRSAAQLGFEEGRTEVIAAVEDAVRWGADAVLSYLFLGLSDAAAEAEGIRRNGEINRACERLGIVHVIESMARGGRMTVVNKKEYVALHTRIAAELGADVIKTDFLDRDEDTAEVMSHALVPVLLAGGAKMDEKQALAVIEHSVRAGASGIIFGRNVFQSADPAAFIREAKRIIHES
jgi:DhnA family fructose-bisphosphate aldolase class Ia